MNGMIVLWITARYIGAAIPSRNNPVDNCWRVYHYALYTKRHVNKQRRYAEYLTQYHDQEHCNDNGAKELGLIIKIMI